MAMLLKALLYGAAVLVVAFLAVGVYHLVRWLRAHGSRPIVSGVIAGAVVLFVLWKVPQWQVAPVRSELAPRDFFELENSFRATLAQIFGGLALLGTIYLTWRRVAATEQQVEVAREGQITERFTRATEQLGSDKLEVRLGGIYALERIAKDSERDHWPIMEVLTAYVRERAPRPSRTSAEPTLADSDSASLSPAEPPPLPQDIQAILTVLGRRRHEFEKDPRLRLDLLDTDLRAAHLPHAHLEGANLWRAHLDYAHLHHANLKHADLRLAHLNGADLQRADLTGAKLETARLEGVHLGGARLSDACLRRAYLQRACLAGASLWQAHLQGAHLQGADLTGADLRNAHLENAELTDAHLKGADLTGAHLTGATGLTREQINEAITDGETVLPDYLAQTTDADQSGTTDQEEDAAEGND